MTIQIELNDEEKKQAFLDYCWKHYGLDGDEVYVYPSLGQVTFYYYPEREKKDDPTYTD